MAIISLESLPVRYKGKGNTWLLLEVDDCVNIAHPVYKHQNIILHAGKRHMKLKSNAWQHYIVDRGSKGKFLPRGFTKIQHMDIV